MCSPPGGSSGLHSQHKNVPVNKTTPNRVWTVAEAKARLSEVLRLAEEEGPQLIGIWKPFVVVPAAVWEEKTRPRKPLASGS